jgi:hypothetical protein
VIQTYDTVGAAVVREQVAEAKLRGAASISIYVVETASDEELAAFAEATKPPAPAVDAATLRATSHAYVRGAVAILDHGTPSELRAWAELFGGASNA